MTEPSDGHMKRRPDRAALGIAALLVAIALVIIFDMQRIRLAGAYDRIGPTTVPYGVAAGLLVMAVGTIIEAFRGSFPEREAQEVHPVLIVVGGLVAQMILLPFAGFTVATGVLFAATAYGFGERRLHLSLPFGLVLAGLVWFAFAQLLRLTLPAGPPEQFAVNLLRSLSGTA